MSYGYTRVIPRDLFNEGSLLKCLGKLYLELENSPDMTLEGDGRPFDIQQDESDGSLCVMNVELLIHGKNVGLLTRPLNSREPWPLYLYLENGDRVPVLTDDGNLTYEMGRLVQSFAGPQS